MEFNKETFEKALKANKIVRYQKHFEAVVKSYLEIDNQALRIHDVVGRSEQLPCGECGKCEMLGDAAPCDECYRNGNYR